jgi:hypothetical protein
MVGQDPHQRLMVNVDNDEWYEYNKEYYKLRDMEVMMFYGTPDF